MVINAAKVVLTGRKLDQKIYYRHSGYIGGLKQVKYRTLMETRPEKAVELAVKGMLPKNKIGDASFARLKVYAGAEHKQQEMCIRDRREGEGTYTYANGAVYTGEWKDGAMEGQGVFTSEAGTYTGSFKAGAFDGYGVYEFANGDRYEGDYVAGKRQSAEATLTYSGGGSYTGAFENDLFHGEGTLTYANGDICLLYTSRTTATAIIFRLWTAFSGRDRKHCRPQPPGRCAAHGANAPKRRPSMSARPPWSS